MIQDDHIQEPDAAPAAETRPGRRRPSLLLLLAPLAAMAVLAVAGGVSWRAQGRRAAELEQALAAATAERDAASAGAEQRQAVLDQAEAEREELDARRLELERELAAAREELARLRAEVASRATQATGRPEPATARAEAATPPADAGSRVPATPEPAAPPAAIAGTAGPATGPAVAGPPAPTSTGGERAAGEPGVEALEERLASAGTDSPAGPASGQAAAPAEQEPSEAETAAAAPEPSAGPAAEAESLTVTFDVNSSYLPASLDGRLRRLAERLERGRRYEVELTASVGTGPVANAGDAGAAARYNRWLAERRVDRVAEFLRENAGTGADALAIERDFVADDSSRRVVVQVRPVP